jgi:hypothetical protein
MVLSTLPMKKNGRQHYGDENRQDNDNDQDLN